MSVGIASVYRGQKIQRLASGGYVTMTLSRLFGSTKGAKRAIDREVQRRAKERRVTP